MKRIGDILDTIKELRGMKKDVDLEIDMGIPFTTLSRWRRRGTLKKELLDYCKAKKLPFDVVLFEGTPNINKSSNANLSVGNVSVYTGGLSITPNPVNKRKKPSVRKTRLSPELCEVVDFMNQSPDHYKSLLGYVRNTRRLISVQGRGRKK